jgi:hypothetical protein
MMTRPGLGLLRSIYGSGCDLLKRHVTGRGIYGETAAVSGYSCGKNQ